jgi:hypothetical protein
MNSSSEPWTRAIAYLKTKVPEDDPSPVITTSEADSPILRDLGNGLLVAYLVDEGNEFSYIQNRHIVGTGVTEAALHCVAVQNLASLADQRLRVQPYGHIFAVLMDGNFEASILLLDSLWDSAFREYVDGDYLAALPARDVLAFGDALSSLAVAELQAVIARLEGSKADHVLSSCLYRRREGAWVRYAA